MRLLARLRPRVYRQVWEDARPSGARGASAGEHAEARSARRQRASARSCQRPAGEPRRHPGGVVEVSDVRADQRRLNTANCSRAMPRRRSGGSAGATVGSAGGWRASRSLDAAVARASRSVGHGSKAISGWLGAGGPTSRRRTTRRSTPRPPRPARSVAASARRTAMARAAAAAAPVPGRRASGRGRSSGAPGGAPSGRASPSSPTAAQSAQRAQVRRRESAPSSCESSPSSSQGRPGVSPLAALVVRIDPSVHLGLFERTAVRTVSRQAGSASPWRGNPADDRLQTDGRDACPKRRRAPLARLRAAIPAGGEAAR